jgi:integrase
MAKKSTKSEGKRPYKDYPLRWHKSQRYWYKTHDGKPYYFGSRGCDAYIALEEFNQRWPGILAGKEKDGGRRSNRGGGPTVKDLIKKFFEHCDERVRKTDEAKREGNPIVGFKKMGHHVVRNYRAAANRIEEHLGGDRKLLALTTDDFDGLANSFATKKNGESTTANTYSNYIRYTRVIFGFAFDEDVDNPLIDKPIRFGKNFVEAPAGEKRKSGKQKSSDKDPIWEPDAFLEVYNLADIQMRAMMLLAANCGFTNVDVGTIEFDYIDLKNRWHWFPRDKKEKLRECRLWPETVAAIKAWLAVRPKAKPGHENFVFLRPETNDCWHDDTKSYNAVTDAFSALDPPDGLTFRIFRHTFETVANAANDQPTVDHIMGHAKVGDTIPSQYRRGWNEKRLKRVSKVVRKHYKPAIAPDSKETKEKKAKRKIEKAKKKLENAKQEIERLRPHDK